MSDNTGLSEKEIASDPFLQFERWYKEQIASGIEIPDAVSLGTSTLSGQVSVRTVLLKEYSEKGFVFFTNFNSRKALQLSANQKAAMLFYWSGSGRQIRIEGTTIVLSDSESEAYFSSRPRESQIGAWASEQSAVIPNRKHLEQRYELYDNLFAGKQVPRPQHWGGYRLEPDWFEFWQDREFRLHDRITFTRKNNIWIVERLAP